MTDDVARPAISARSRFWAAVRLTWMAALVLGMVLSLVDHSDGFFGCLGGLLGMTLLEVRLVREGRSPYLDRWLLPGRSPSN